MDEPSKWGLRRYATLLFVFMLHLALIAALLMTSRPGALAPPTANSIQLLLLSPVNLPKVRSQIARSHGLSANTPIAIAPPVLDSVLSTMPPASASASAGHGSGIDWAAEARRALQAFEIRTHNASSKELDLQQPGGGQLVAAEARRRPVQDPDRRLDRMDQPRLLPSSRRRTKCLRAWGIVAPDDLPRPIRHSRQ